MCEKPRPIAMIFVEINNFMRWDENAEQKRAKESLTVIHTATRITVNDYAFGIDFSVFYVACNVTSL